MMIHGPWPFFICKDTCIPVEGSWVRLLLLLVVCYTQKLIFIDGTCIIRSVSVLVSLFCSCEVSYVGGEWWTTINTIKPRAIRLPNSIPDDDDQIHIWDSPTCHNIFLYIQSQIWELCTPAAFSSRPLFDAKPFQPADGQWEKEAKQNPRAQPSSSSAWHPLLLFFYFLAKAAICIHHSHSRIELLLISALKGQHDLRQMMKCIHWAKYKYVRRRSDEV